MAQISCSVAKSYHLKHFSFKTTNAALLLLQKPISTKRPDPILRKPDNQVSNYPEKITTSCLK
jgi:hypothetical protein